MSAPRKRRNLATPAELAEYLGRSMRWTTDPKLNPIRRVKLGKPVRFDWADIDEYVTNAKEPGRTNDLRPVTRRSA